MDFIERIFHVSPDGGSGTLELLLLLIPLLGVSVTIVLKLSKRFPTRQ
jgi:hypothetical protein